MKQGDSVADVVEIVEDVAVPDMIVDVDPEEDSSLTYDQYIAQRRLVDADQAIQVREVVIDESQFQKVRQLTRESDADKVDEESEEDRAARKKSKAKKLVTLDEFRSDFLP